MLWTILLLWVLILIYLFLTRKFNYWENKKVPYIKPILFFGNAFDIFTFKKSLGEALRNFYLSTQNPFIGFFIIDEPYLLIRDPHLLKRILVQDFQNFTDRTATQNTQDDPLGSYMLLLLRNPEWSEMRKKVTPVFSTAKIRSMYRLLSKAAEDFLDFLKKSNEKSIDVKEAAAKYGTDAIVSTAFGIDANCFKLENAEFRQVSRKVFNFDILERAISTTCFFVAPSLVKLFRLRFIDKQSTDFLRDAFWKTMNKRQIKNFVRNDLLDVLIEMKNSGNLDGIQDADDKIVALAAGFFVAGFETISTTITFLLFELACHPEIQNRLREEIIKTKQKHEEFGFESLKDMEYLEMCIKEAMRKYPALPFLDRRCKKEYAVPGSNVVLEKDTLIYISIWGLHFDEKYYPNPYVFDPTRFTEENIKSRPQCTYLPFGEGPRSCIGRRYAMLSMKCVMASIMSQFEIELGENVSNSMTLSNKGFLVAPKKPLFLKFKILKCADE